MDTADTLRIMDRPIVSGFMALCCTRQFPGRLTGPEDGSSACAMRLSLPMSVASALHYHMVQCSFATSSPLRGSWNLLGPCGRRDTLTNCVAAAASAVPRSATARVTCRSSPISSAWLITIGLWSAGLIVDSSAQFESCTDASVLQMLLRCLCSSSKQTYELRHASLKA